MAEEEVDQDQVITLSLKVNEVNIVLAGLQELPFKVADPLIKNIVAQGQEQLGITTEQ